MSATMLDTEGLAAQILEGDGIVVLEGHFDRALTAEARARTYELARTEPDAARYSPMKVPSTHRGIWNLLQKGEAFRAMAADPGMLSVLEAVLGQDLLLSSLAAKILFPGAPAQKPHLDYPYADLFEPHRWPRNLNSSFLLEVEVIIMLDDFTGENGATALVPGSQRLCRWPDEEEFKLRQVQVSGPAGTVFMFGGPTWHAGQANRSGAPRAAILGAYTCKCVRPLEQLAQSLSAETLSSCPDRLKRLLGLDFYSPPCGIEGQ